MADRFPLILNTSTNQIQEIPSGDTLDLTGSNIKGVGIITAANISGNIIAGAGTSNIVSGIITAVAADIDDFVDVGSNIQLGNAGVITATTFKGDGDFVELDVDGHTNLDNVSIAGVTTIAQDLDVDGHTNLDNVSIAGVTTIATNTTIGGNLTVNGTNTILNTTTYVKGGEGADGILAIYADEGDDNNDKWRLRSGANNAFYIDNYANGSWQANLAATATSTQLYSAGYIKLNTTTNGINVYNGESGGTTTINVTKGSGDAEVVCQRTGGSGIKLRGSHPVSYLETTTDSDLRIRRNTDTRITLGSSGNTIAGDTTFSGNVSIGGTLTYEDVTNIDSVGIVTARNGLKVTGGTSNFSGASHFVGIARFNQTIVGTARTAIKLTCQDESTDTTTYPLFVAATTGDQFPKTGTNLSFNSASGALSATSFVGGGSGLTSLSGSVVASALSGEDISGLGNIGISGALDVNGTTNTVNITHTSGHGLSITRSSKSVSINANYGASNTHAAVETTSGMDLRFYLGGGEKIKFESAGNIVPTTDSQITLGNSSKRFTAVWADYVEANNFGSNGVYSGKFGRIRIGADVYGNTIKTESDNNLNITVPHSVYFNTSANANGSDAGTSRLRIYDGGIVPMNDKAIDLGSTSIAWRNVYTDNIVTTTALSNRNVIHNGTMFVAQRGTSQSGVNSSGYAKAADRWKLEANGSNVGTYTVSRSTDNPGEFGYSYKIQCTTARSSLANNEMYELVQYIEGRNVQRFNKGNSAAKSFALSFYVKTNKTGTYAVLLLDHQHSRMCCANYTVSNTGWNRYEIVFPPDTTGSWSYSVNRRLSVKFVLLTGSDFSSGTLQTTWGSAVNANSRVGHNVNLADSVGNVFYITGIQLEAASACTPYEHKDYTHVLRECQRYLFTTHMLGAGVWNGPSSFFTAVRCPVPMRAHPTVTTNSGSFGNINIEHEDNYGINGITNPSSGHGNPNSTAAQQHSGFTDFVLGLNVSYTANTGYGGLALCDAASDYFILDAQL